MDKVEKLIRELKDWDSYVRRTAAEALKKIFPSHKLFLDSYPYLLCTNCMLRVEKKKAKLGLFKKCSYVVCRVVALQKHL